MNSRRRSAARASSASRASSARSQPAQGTDASRPTTPASQAGLPGFASERVRSARAARCGLDAGLHHPMLLSRDKIGRKSPCSRFTFMFSPSWRRCVTPDYAVTRPVTLAGRTDGRERTAALPSDAEAAMVGVREPPQRQQKENISEFVARKREIFLVQMSLDTKRAEIRALQVSRAWASCSECLQDLRARLHLQTRLSELHASAPSQCVALLFRFLRCPALRSDYPTFLVQKRRAAQRAEALRLSEAMLEEDAAKFDAFLKDNDAAVQDAQRRADAETAARQVKVRALSLFLHVPLSCVTRVLQPTRLSTLDQILHFGDRQVRSLPSRLRQVGEMKRLEVALAEARSEASKAEESLEELAALRAFLDGLTPAHHFQVTAGARRPC